MVPKHAEYLNNFDFFPLQEQVAKGFKGGDGAVILVDVGGARGHEVEAIKKKYLNLRGRFILQNLPATVEQELPVPDMEAVAHDSFTAQPVKGRCLKHPFFKPHANSLARCAGLARTQCPPRLAQRRIPNHPLTARGSNDA